MERVAQLYCIKNKIIRRNNIAFLHNYVDFHCLKTIKLHDSEITSAVVAVVGGGVLIAR